jgi:hypothetical protein
MMVCKCPAPRGHSSRPDRGRRPMIRCPLRALPLASSGLCLSVLPKKQKTHSAASGSKFLVLLLYLQNRPSPPSWVDPKSKPIRIRGANHGRSLFRLSRRCNYFFTAVQLRHSLTLEGPSPHRILDCMGNNLPPGRAMVARSRRNAAVPLVHLGTMFVHKRIVGHLGKFVAQCVHVDEGRRIAKNIVGDAVSSLVAKANTRIKILLST